MTEARLEYLSAGTLLLVCALVGFPVLLYGGESLLIPVWVWCACYLGYLLTMIGVFLTEGSPRSGRVHRMVQPALLGLLVLLGAVIVLSSPGTGWTPIMLVITTAMIAQLHWYAASIVVLVLNTGLVVLAAHSTGASLTDSTLAGMIYASLQALSVWAVISNIRETEARRQLAAANVELRGATALLAESSRVGERLRIARELHDLVGHQLTALALELEVAVNRTDDPVTRDHVQRGRDLTKDLLRDVRQAVGELRAHPVQLRAALQDVAVQLPRPRVHIALDEELAPDEERVTTLIRCVQEVLTNAIRHSEAENVWIEVRSKDGGIVFDARDDGRGTTLLRMGNGLTGLRERVEMLGGNVRFDTRDGFRVLANLPVGAST